MPNPVTPIYGLPFEDPDDEPGETLTGGSGGTHPILAEATEAELERIDGDIATFNASVAALDSRLDILETFTLYDIAIKSANQSVVSSTTYVNDNHLFLDLVAGAYIIEMALFWDAHASGDFKHKFIYGATGGGRFIDLVKVPISGPSDSLMSIFSMGNDNAHAGIAAGDIQACYVTGQFSPVSTDVFRLQWAQNTSFGTATTVRTGSWLRATKIG